MRIYTVIVISPSPCIGVHTERHTSGGGMITAQQLSFEKPDAAKQASFECEALSSDKVLLEATDLLTCNEMACVVYRRPHTYNGVF